jgi:hypothetical protein
MTKADSLEALLEDSELSGEQKVDSSGMGVSDIIPELDNALNKYNFYGKSNITKRNLRGILKAASFQNFLSERYGFRIRALDALISAKMENVLSVEGLGRRQVIEMIQKGTVKVEAKSGVDILDRLMGSAPR